MAKEQLEADKWENKFPQKPQDSVTILEGDKIKKQCKNIIK